MKALKPAGLMPHSDRLQHAMSSNTLRTFRQKLAKFKFMSVSQEQSSQPDDVIYVLGETQQRRRQPPRKSR